MKFVFGAALLGSLAFVSMAAHAERPLEPAKFVFDAGSGYIYTCIGPMEGKKSFKRWVGFVRLDPLSGQVVIEDRGQLRSTNARRVKDAAAIYYEAKPWALNTKNDTACFLIAVNPGTWVIGSVDNTVLAMGSYAFEVKAGEITHVGTVFGGFEDGKSAIPEIAGAKISDDLIEFGTWTSLALSSNIHWTVGDSGNIPVDLQSHKFTIGDPRADVRFQNYEFRLVGRAAQLGPMTHQSPVSKAASYNSYIE